MAKIIYMDNRNIYNRNLKGKIDVHINNRPLLVDGAKKLHTEAQRRVCEYGNFTEVKVNIKNKSKDLKIKSFDLFIKPSILLKERPKERELGIKVNSLNNDSCSIVLYRGEKDDILKKLQDKNFILEVEDFLKEAHNDFEMI